MSVSFTSDSRPDTVHLEIPSTLHEALEARVAALEKERASLSAITGRLDTENARLAVQLRDLRESVAERSGDRPWKVDPALAAFDVEAAAFKASRARARDSADEIATGAAAGHDALRSASGRVARLPATYLPVWAAMALGAAIVGLMEWLPAILAALAAAWG